MNNDTDYYYYNTVRSGGGINSTENKVNKLSKIIEDQPQKSDLNVTNNYFRNEEKCKPTNRQLMECLNYHKGNFFYCNDFYNNYIECMQFNQL